MHTMFRLLIQSLFAIMGVTPTYASITFFGLASRQKKNIDTYIADVDAALTHFDAGTGATSTSPQTYVMDEPGAIIDIAVVTGPTVISKLQVGRNRALLPGVYRLVPHLTTNALRPQLNIPFAKGDELTVVERV